MKTNTIVGLFVAIFAIAAFVPLASAQFAEITDVNVNGVSHFDTTPTSDDVLGVTAGDVIPVWVTFTVDDGDAVAGEVFQDARIVARILGEPGFSEISERFDVIEGNTYSRMLNVALPYDLDEDLDDSFTLEITIENNDEGDGGSVRIPMRVQRSNYELEILSVEANDRIAAGENLAVDVVIKNRGRHEAEDTFIVARIPELGISKRLFLGDLAEQDRGDDREEEFDSEGGRVFLAIPRDAPAGVYTLEVEAFTDDSTTVVTRKVVVMGASEESVVVSSGSSKTFAVNEEKAYTLTVVNAGDSIKIYDLVLEAADGINVDLEESVIAVPAGSSRTVTLLVSAENAGTYDFTVNVHSDGELVREQTYVANVEGRNVAGNSAVLLTVVLAIVFVVLLIVLIVLLTRKPDKTQEASESYY